MTTPAPDPKPPKSASQRPAARPVAGSRTERENRVRDEIANESIGKTMSSSLGCGFMIVLIIGILGLIGWGISALFTPSQNTSNVQESSATQLPDATPLVVGPECDTAMAQAAAVPLDRVNDAELGVAAEACTSAEELIVAATRYPLATGVTSFSETDYFLFLRSVCYLYPQSAACVDAEAKGYLTQ
jgi:hypothetical protein